MSITDAASLGLVVVVGAVAVVIAVFVSVIFFCIVVVTVFFIVVVIVFYINVVIVPSSSPFPFMVPYLSFLSPSSSRLPFSTPRRPLRLRHLQNRRLHRHLCLRRRDLGRRLRRRRVRVLRFASFRKPAANDHLHVESLLVTVRKGKEYEQGRGEGRGGIGCNRGERKIKKIMKTRRYGLVLILGPGNVAFI